MDTVKINYFSSTCLADVKMATDSDPELQAVLDYTLSGWPEYINDVPVYLRKYYEIRAHLSVSDRLLLYDDRIYIPRSLQQEVLLRIHDGHQGINKCRERARSSVYWIGISTSIQNVVKSCDHCQTYQNTQWKEPMISTPLPDHPW